MIPVLTKEQAYKLDKETIESGHLSQEELMENAGKAVAQFFCEKIQNPFSKTVIVVCGKGNNGGDGVVAHSYLKKYYVSSKIVFTEKNHGHSKLLKKYKISKSEFSFYNKKIKFDNYDWVIDGVFGIGLSRNLSDKYIKIIKELNKNKNIISIDISSGLFANSSKSTFFVNSKHVITFGYPKLGHYLETINDLYITDIGFKSISSDIQNVEFSDVCNILKSFKIKSNIHKYSTGRIAINAGSFNYPGAALLSSRAACKTGASYVNLFIYPNTNYNQDQFNNLISNIKSSYPDLIVYDQGYINSDFDEEDNPMPKYNNVLFGPGIDYKQDDNFLSGLEQAKNLVIDAGGFQSFPDISAYHHKKTILTPHLGEFKRIFQLKDNEIVDIDLLKSVQKKIDQKIIILKSFNIFIITKDMIYIMSRGPSLLATAGTGDVLSGILVSLLSHGYSRLEASILGTYLHAEAANYYMNNISNDGMIASDLIDCIPHAFNELRRNSEL